MAMESLLKSLVFIRCIAIGAAVYRRESGGERLGTLGSVLSGFSKPSHYLTHDFARSCLVLTTRVVPLNSDL